MEAAMYHLDRLVLKLPLHKVSKRIAPCQEQWKEPDPAEEEFHLNLHLLLLAGWLAVCPIYQDLN